VDDRERSPRRLWRELVSETAAQDGVDHGVQSLLGEAVPVRLGLPDIELSEAALWSLDSEMNDEPLGWLVAKTIEDAPVHGGIDRDVLGERVAHASSRT
jgi:hypothetical protein